MYSIISKLLTGLLVLQSISAFVPNQQSPRPVFAHLAASPKPISEKLSAFLTTAAVVISTSPFVALAEEVDDYEYGAVNAPIGIAWAAGCLAILTALLPIALSGGENAFNEMKDRDADKWGTGNSDALNRRKK